METQNKQWVCHPTLDNSGQLGPEDLSSNSKSLLNRPGIIEKRTNIPNNEQQVLSDIQNKNGLDQFFVQQIEDGICESTRQTVMRILDEVSRLTSVEKLLLYLKLPTDLNNVTDPLRQPLNPLGSRTEISQTIMWIRTHLEEDPELSLPKQEVYNEYTIHCANNKMKPLSTADFGKVMKQVYPSVRPRRLGTRGNSRYCYAGLRKRFKLEVPQLPDLGDRPQSTEAVCSQSELNVAACSIVCEWAESILGSRFQSVHSLASYLVRHASQAINANSGAVALLTSFMEVSQHKEVMSPSDLPYSNHVNLKHKEAQLQLQRKLQQREFKRKLQLHSPKAEAKSKCKKSKLQSSSTPTCTVSLDSVESESPKSQGYQLNIVCDKSTNDCINVHTLPEFSSLKKTMPGETDVKFSNDKPAVKNETTTVETPIQQPQTSVEYQVPKLGKNIQNVSRSNSLDNEIYDVNQVQDDNLIDPKPNFAGKLPIPRLPNPKIKPSIAPPKSVILQAPRKSQRNLKYKAIQPKPVKCDTQGELTQDTNLDTADTIETLKNTDYLTRERLISVSNVDKDALDDYLHGGNNSQEQEEELMQYFKNNNSNPEQNTASVSSSIGTTGPHREPDEFHVSKLDKLSQLRLLLEQNFNTNIGMMNAPQSNAIRNPSNLNHPIGSNSSAFIKAPSASAGLTMLSQNVALQSHINSGVKRRVSFETSVLDNDTVPPSPNTRRKNFSFTPISPGPHSPGGGRQSKCNSTNASPFVSPRNTPVPRAKISHSQSQSQSSFVAQQSVPSSRKNVTKPTLKPIFKPESEMFDETGKIFNDLIEEQHFVNPTDIMPKSDLPMSAMSAPPSPMLPYKHKMNNSNLLQKLLDSNSKVSYTPDYDKSIQNPGQGVNTDSLAQEVSQLLSENGHFNPSENSYRSQSVPLHQMSSFKTLMSPCLPNSQQTHFNFNFVSANNSVAPTPVPNEFSDFETFSELNTGLNNENLNQILNILETTQTETAAVTDQALTGNEAPQTENVFTFDTDTSNLLTAVENPMMSVQKLIRSQSIDLDIDMRGFNEGQKYIQPSRSVPSTPLPYSKAKFDPELNINNNIRPALGENMFTCNRPLSNQDYLLNGQPVKGKFLDQVTSDISNDGKQFPQSLGFSISNNDNKIDSFTTTSVENYGARRNLNPLLEQQFAESDEFTAVPRLNSGTS